MAETNSRDGLPPIWVPPSAQKSAPTISIERGGDWQTMMMYLEEPTNSAAGFPIAACITAGGRRIRWFRPILTH